MVGEDEVVDKEELQARINELGNLITTMDKLPDPKVKALVAEYKKEKEELHEKLRSAKPFEVQAKVLASRTEKAKKALEKQKGLVQATEAKLAALQRELEEQKVKEVECEQAVAELHKQYAALSATLPVAPSEIGAKVPGFDVSVQDLGPLLAALGAEATVVQLLTATATRMQEEQAQQQQKDKGEKEGREQEAAAATVGGAGAQREGGAQTNAAPATSSPAAPAPASSPAPPAPPAATPGSAPSSAGSPTQPAAKASPGPAAGGGVGGGLERSGDFPMGEEDLNSLRSELLAAGLSVQDASEDQLRLLGERVGAWTTAMSKRQRRAAKA